MLFYHCGSTKRFDWGLFERGKESAYEPGAHQVMALDEEAL
jgi:hypothetical protein